MIISPEPDSIVWQKSSHSASSGACVEVASAPDRVLVRDSKDPDGLALAVPTHAWLASPHGGRISGLASRTPVDQAALSAGVLPNPAERADMVGA